MGNVQSDEVATEVALGQDAVAMCEISVVSEETKERPEDFIGRHGFGPE